MRELVTELWLACDRILIVGGGCLGHGVGRRLGNRTTDGNANPTVSFRPFLGGSWTLELGFCFAIDTTFSVQYGILEV